MNGDCTHVRGSLVSLFSSEAKANSGGSSLYRIVVEVVSSCHLLRNHHPSPI
jgi:hypothetical protein